MRSKRWTPLCFLLSLFAGFSPALGSLDSTSSVLGPPDVAESAHEAHGESADLPDKVQVVVPMDCPPLAFIGHDGRVSGIVPDLLFSVFEQAGLEVEASATGSSGVSVGMGGWKADFALLLTDPPGPGEGILATEPFLNTVEAFVTRQDKSGIQDFQDLHGKAVTVVEGSPAMNHPGLQSSEVRIAPKPSALEALLDVASGSADAFFGFLPTAAFLVGQNRLDDLTITVPPHARTIHFRIGVTSDNPGLRDRLQAALEGVDDADRRAMENRYVCPGMESGIQWPFSLTPRQREWLKSHPEIRLGVDTPRPPFEWLGPDGRYEGMISEVVTIVGGLLGIKLEPVLGLSCTQALQGAKDGTIDVLARVTRSLENAPFLRFTRPYLVSQGVLVVGSKAPIPGSLKDLAGKRAAVVSGDVAERRMGAEYPEIRLVKVPSVEEGLRAVLDGRAEGLVDSLDAVTYHLAALGPDSIRLACPAGFVFEYSMGVRWDWPELVPILDGALASLTDPTRSAIHDRWARGPVEPPGDRRLLWLILSSVAAGGVSALMVAWASKRRLAREAVSRKELEQRLGEQGALLSELLDSLSDMVFFKDVSGAYIRCNPAFSRFAGRPVQEIAGRTDYGIFSREIADLFRENDRVAVKTGETALMREWVMRPDGSRMLLEISKAPVCDEKGRILGILGLARDITHQRPEAEQKEQ